VNQVERLKLFRKILHNNSHDPSNEMPTSYAGAVAGTNIHNHHGGSAATSGMGHPLLMEEPTQQEKIRVCLRLRPQNKLEEARRSKNCVSVDGKANGNGDGGKRILVDSPLEGDFDFEFDEVFQENAPQSAVFQHAAAPLASDLLDGFNCALITYGQTGSGKSHTMMGASDAAATSSSSKSSSAESASNKNPNNETPNNDEKSGMIHRLTKEIFHLMKDSPPTVEYIVRCSFVEIYLEKVLDLLNPVNRSIRILSSMDDDAEAGGLMGSLIGGVGNGNCSSPSRDDETFFMKGASEACCFDESDVISLLVRGNACRTVSSTKMNTDSSRSHAIFVLKIEQKDHSTGISKTSQLHMIDMAGSELGGGKNKAVMGTMGTAIHQEAKMINKSLSALNAVVKTIHSNRMAREGGDGGGGGVKDIPYGHSKLTKVLRDAFGGNCRTSVILTASPASYNISESIRTMKFGHYCRNVTNFVKPSVEMSPVDYRKLLNDSHKKQGDLIDLVNELSAECFQLKQDAKNNKFVETHYNGPLWETIEAILVNGAAPVVNKAGRASSHAKDPADIAALRDELAKTKAELEASKKARGNLENLLSERQSEVAVLRTQNDNFSSEKKKTSQELVAAKNEIRKLTQRKQEVEHNLRTSQFREYEATVFLRQFRRFYRRLLRNKAAQGTGSTSDVIEKVPGVPDLNDLIDVDSLLLESGLIEDSELHDDTATGAYRPSAQALGRSTDAANKAWKEAVAQGKVAELEELDRFSLEGRRHPPSRVGGGRNDDVSVLADGGASVSAGGGADAGAGSSVAPYGQLITNRQQFLGTPAGRLTTMRERELERDLLRATERCIELQVALNEEKANVDILTNRAGNLNKKKFAQETIQLKQQLDKKTHDLQAIIWKMNELHLINKTYNEKMSNREQHVTYLEENLVELQSSNRNMILERQEAETKLREELENLKVLVDAMTVPLWQFGECGITGRTLASRIRLPIRGGEQSQPEESEHDEDESLESLEESVVSDEDDEEEEDEEEEEEEETDAPGPPPVAVTAADLLPPPAPAPIQPVQIITQKNVPMRDAATQTFIAVQEQGTMTDVLQLQPPPRPSTMKDGSGSTSAEPPTQPSITPAAPTGDKRPQRKRSVEEKNPYNSAAVDKSSYETEAEQQPKSSVGVSLTPPHTNPTQVTDKTMSNGDAVLNEEDLFRGGKPANSQPRRYVHKFGLMIRPGVLKESSPKPKAEPSRTR